MINNNRYASCVIVVIPSFLFYSWVITRFLMRVTRQVPLVEQNCLPFRSIRVLHTVLCGFYVAQFSFFCVVFCRPVLSCCLCCFVVFCSWPSPFGHCIACPSLNVLWLLTLWYLSHTINEFINEFRTNLCSWLPELVQSAVWINTK